MPMGPGGSYKPENLFPTDFSIRSHAGERALSINGSQLGTWAVWLFISAQSLSVLKLCRTTTIQQKQQDRKATCTLEILLICFILLREDIEPIHLADFFKIVFVFHVQRWLPKALYFSSGLAITSAIITLTFPIWQQYKPCNYPFSYPFCLCLYC